MLVNFINFEDKDEEMMGHLEIRKSLMEEGVCQSLVTFLIKFSQLNLKIYYKQWESEHFEDPSDSFNGYLLDLKTSNLEELGQKINSHENSQN